VVVDSHVRTARAVLEIAEIVGMSIDIAAVVAVHVQVVVAGMPTASGAEAEAFRVVGICSGVARNMGIAHMADSVPLSTGISVGVFTVKVSPVSTETKQKTDMHGHGVWREVIDQHFQIRLSWTRSQNGHVDDKDYLI
jgi:hypothetical protein